MNGVTKKQAWNTGQQDVSSLITVEVLGDGSNNLQRPPPSMGIKGGVVVLDCQSVSCAPPERTRIFLGYPGLRKASTPG
jgi:hypothetical protein